MGNCCAVPQTFDEDVKGRHKSNPFAVDSDDQAIPKGGYKLKSRVLDNPTGHDIEEFYEVGRELGRGEFGVTYLCSDKSCREVFACKSISKIKLRTRVDIEDVKREVEIMKRLPNHPNIVSLKDTCEDNNGVHLVMELCEDGELFDRIVARGHYTERAAAVVTRTIVEVIQIGDGDNHDIIPKDIDSTPAACCSRGEHYPLLDEQIGIKCRYCSTVLLEIEDVLPPFVSNELGPFSLIERSSSLISMNLFTQFSGLLGARYFQISYGTLIF